MIGGRKELWDNRIKEYGKREKNRENGKLDLDIESKQWVKGYKCSDLWNETKTKSGSIVKAIINLYQLLNYDLLLN